MKNIILSIFFILASIFSFAQTDKRIAPDFTAITMDNDTLILSELLTVNKFVLLEFFFTENQFCQETSPFVSEAYNTMGQNGDGVFFISINVGNDSSECANYIDSLSLEGLMVTGLEGNGNIIADSFNIASYPTIILIGDEILIAHDSTKVDTIIDGVTEYVYTIVDGDTIFEWNVDIYDYNIYANDIWPVNSSDDIIDVLRIYSSINDPIEKTAYTFHLYPNPNNGQFYIKSNSMNGSYDYQIIDLSGRGIYSGQVDMIKNQEASMSIGKLPEGAYFLILNDGSHVYTQKLIMQ